MTTLILNATHLITPRGRTALAGDQQRDVVRIDRPAIAARDGRIVFVGPQEELRAHVDMSQADVIIDADGCAVLPGFVDPHTHAVFAGDRRDELQRRLAGVTYAEIAAAGGGIVSTVRATREATEDELVAQSLPRLRAMARCGTTTCEIKSGYGLEVEAELRMLRAIRHLGQRQPIDIAATFMGAHEIPVERRADRAGYIAAVVDEMVPRVARESLAEWIDVFCEAGVFTPDESAAILGAGLAHGMRARIHADELGASGGSLVARQVGARSADHLVHVDPDGIAALRAGGVIATLLPIAAFYLKLGRFAPARDLIAAGVPVALATDLNPGGGFSPSMPFAMTLACFGMAMTAEEALVAATLNAACALDRGDSIGSLETGKLCDAVLVRGTLVDVLRVGVEAIATVVKRGRVVHPFDELIIMSLLDLTGRDLLAAFSADTPTPGGGSASAYAGAMGASLLAMVSHLKKTRNNSDEERAVLVDAGAKLLALRDDLARLTDDDTAAFDAVMAAFKRPKATDEEKSARTAAVQAASLEATVVPLRVMQAASDALMLALTVARFGNRNAASDVHVGVSLLLAAVGGANENVEINLPSLTDEARRLKLREDAAIVRTRAAQAASQAKAALRP